MWEAPRDARERGMRERLGDAEARSLTEQPQTDEEVRRGQAADRLDLHLLDVPRGDVVRLADEGRELAQVPVDLVHVMTANPQRHGGCGRPQPIPEPPAFAFTTAAPADAGQGTTIAVLDTGISGSALPFPFQAPAQADVEPPASAARRSATARWSRA